MQFDESSTKTAIRPPVLIVRGLVAVVLVVAVTAVVLAIGRELLTVPPGFEPLQWRPAMLSAAAGAVGGTVVYGAIDRLSSQPDIVFTVVATLVLLASFVPIVTAFLGTVDPAILGFVALLHVTVAVITVRALIGRWPTHDR